MARPREPLDLKADASGVREKLKDRQLEGWQRQRLQAVLLALEGEKTYPQIALQVGTSGRSVSFWLGLFRKGGIEGVLTRRAAGKGVPSWLDPQSQAQLKAELDKAHWRRAEDARPWLEEKLGRKIRLCTVYKYLGKAEARLKVPRPSQVTARH